MDDPHAPLDQLLRTPPARSPVEALLRRVGSMPPPLRWAGLAVSAAAVVLALLVSFRPSPPPIEVDLPRATPDTTPPTTVATSIVAHVAGAVTGPGVVSLPPGARVADAVAAAGGTLPDADLDRVNLAAPIADGGRIYIPTVGGPDVAAVGPSGGAGAEVTAPAQVDLNTATADELETLPGIGPATASAILAHRQRSGPFRRLEDLLEVRGIGPAKLEALRDLVVIR